MRRSMPPTAVRVTGGCPGRSVSPHAPAAGARRPGTRTGHASRVAGICYNRLVNTRRAVLPVLAAVLLLGGCVPRIEPLRPLVSPTPREGIVVYVSGGVQVSRDGAWIDVEPGDTLGAGTILRTDADGSCELQFGDTVSVRVEPDTQFRCDSVAVDARASVGGQLTAGAIIAKVKNLAGSDLQISTPSAIAGVRGTEFMVKVSGSVTTVTVRDGTVRVTQKKTTVDVHAGRRADAAADVAVTEQPAAEEDLAAIDAFVPSAVQTGDVKKLFKILVIVVDPPDADIYIGSDIVGRGAWGAVLEEGDELTLVLKREGYEDDVVFVPKAKGRIVRKLKPSPSVRDESSGAAAPAPRASLCRKPRATAEPSASEDGLTQPEVAPVTVPESPQPGTAPALPEPSAIAEQPREPQPAAGLNLAFRTDPAIGDDPFFREMAAAFAGRVPRFSLVTGPGSANLNVPGVAARGRPGRRHGQRHADHVRAPAAARGREARAATRQLVRMDAARAGSRGCRARGRQGVRGADRRRHPGPVLQQGPRARSAARVERHHGPRGRYAQKGGDALAMASLVPFFMGMFPESRGIQLLVPDTAKTGLGAPRAAAVYDAMRDAVLEAGMSIGLPHEEAVARFRNRDAAMLIDGPWSFGMLRDALGGSLGVAALPSWGSPGVELTPYANVLALFVSAGVNDERAAVLRRFAVFLLEQESQLALVERRLDAGNPIAPARRFIADEAARLEERHEVVPVLYRQLETAVPMPRGPLAPDAWRVFQEVLEGIRRQEGGELLRQMADTRFLLYGLERRPIPPGARELRAVIDPAEKSQGLFFRPWDEESDLRLAEAGGSRGVASVMNLGLQSGGTRSFLYLILNHDPYRPERLRP